MFVAFLLLFLGPLAQAGPPATRPLLSCAGRADACNDLGYAHTTGAEQPQDDALAVAYYAEACANGSALGCANLGHHYLWGYGVRADPLKSVDLYQRACGMGHRKSCKLLGANGNNTLHAASRCRSGKPSGCQIASRSYLEYGGWGLADELPTTLSWDAQVALNGRGCELGNGPSCKREEALKAAYSETRYTPNHLVVDGQEIGPVARACVANANEALCKIAVSRVSPDAYPSAWGPLDRYISAGKLCTLGNAAGCKAKRAIESGEVPMSAKAALGGALSVAGQVAGSMANDLATSGKLGAAYAAAGMGAVAPQIGRDLQGGQDAAWVGQAAGGIRAMAAEIRAGKQDPWARAMGQGPPMGVAAAPAPTASTSCYELPTAALNQCRTQLRLASEECRDRHPKVEGHDSPKYAGCWKEAAGREATCERQVMADWKVAHPECGGSATPHEPSGSGTVEQ